MNTLPVLPCPARWHTPPARAADVEVRGTAALDERLDWLRAQLPALAHPLVIEIEDTKAEMPGLDVDESYRLTVGDTDIHVNAPTVFGAIHALQTLRQLAYGAAVITPVEIVDAPRFAWRGLLLDVARHFLPVHRLREIIDGMSSLKLNVLHLHLTDDQAFRLPVRSWPRLASNESYSAGELCELVSYAARRGIRVVPEVDVPGHVTCWLAAYPELSLAPVNATDRFGVHPACLNPVADATYDMLAEVFGEVAELFPDPYVHLGGDEVHPAWWGDDPQVQTYMAEQGLATIADLQNHFNQRLCAIIRGLGKQPIGWDEVLHPQMPDMLVQNWRGATTRDRALALGQACLVSAPFYLDLHFSAGMHYAHDPTLPQEDWLALEDAQQNSAELDHVAQGIEWTKQWRAGAVAHDGSGTVLGGEACLWSELVDSPTVDARLWSRLPAVAERLWSQAKVRDTEDFYRRQTLWFACSGRAPEAFARERLWAQLSDAQIDTVLYLEPVKWYARLLGMQALQARIDGTEMPQARPYQTQTPLDAVIDFLPPESLRARDLATASAQQLRALAKGWRDLRPESWPDDLVAAMAALQRVGVLVLGFEAGDIDRDAYLTALTELYGPHGEYVLAVIPALRVRLSR
ncbi:MAG: beta-N-acetylhexosaminidase [Pseudomonadota bacterium]